MPEYKDSKIYAIKSSQANKYYIGATTKRLCQRMAQHRQNYNKYVAQQMEYDSSFEVLKFSDSQIQLLEAFECKSKDELNSKLQTYMETYKDNIVNKPKEKKIKIRIKKAPKKEEPVIIKEEIKETPKKEEPKQEIKVEEQKPTIFMNRLQAMRNGLI